MHRLPQFVADPLLMGRKRGCDIIMVDPQCIRGASRKASVHECGITSSSGEKECCNQHVGLNSRNAWLLGIVAGYKIAAVGKVLVGKRVLVGRIGLCSDGEDEKVNGILVEMLLTAHWCCGPSCKRLYQVLFVEQVEEACGNPEEIFDEALCLIQAWFRGPLLCQIIHPSRRTLWNGVGHVMLERVVDQVAIADDVLSKTSNILEEGGIGRIAQIDEFTSCTSECACVVGVSSSIRGPSGVGVTGGRGQWQRRFPVLLQVDADADPLPVAVAVARITVGAIATAVAPFPAVLGRSVASTATATATRRSWDDGFAREHATRRCDTPLQAACARHLARAFLLAAGAVGARSKTSLAVAVFHGLGGHCCYCCSSKQNKRHLGTMHTYMHGTKIRFK